MVQREQLPQMGRPPLPPPEYSLFDGDLNFTGSDQLFSVIPASAYLTLGLSHLKGIQQIFHHIGLTAEFFTGCSTLL